MAAPWSKSLLLGYSGGPFLSTGDPPPLMLSSKDRLPITKSTESSTRSTTKVIFPIAIPRTAQIVSRCGRRIRSWSIPPYHHSTAKIVAVVKNLLLDLNVSDVIDLPVILWKVQQCSEKVEKVHVWNVHWMWRERWGSTKTFNKEAQGKKRSKNRNSHHFLGFDSKFTDPSRFPGIELFLSFFLCVTHQWKTEITSICISNYIEILGRNEPNLHSVMSDSTVFILWHKAAVTVVSVLRWTNTYIMPLYQQIEKNVWAVSGFSSIKSTSLKTTVECPCKSVIVECVSCYQLFLTQSLVQKRIILQIIANNFCDGCSTWQREHVLGRLPRHGY